MTYYTDILTNKWRTVLYIGMTNDIERRTYEHETKINKSFTAKYNCDRLVYYEEYPTAREAIDREKFLKKRFSRKMKEDLINSMNPEWRNLSVEWGITLRGYDG